jgi:DHA2 family multidrug resistance protein-like MFS transporter
MLPLFLPFILGSTLTPVIARRIGPAYAMAGGLGLTAIGYGLLTQVNAGSGLAVVVAASVIYSLGLAPVFTLATDLIVGSAPPERAGAALGGALAVAGRLPEHLGVALLGPAREAFTQGMQLNAALCAVIAPAMALMVARQRSSTW